MQVTRRFFWAAPAAIFVALLGFLVGSPGRLLISDKPVQDPEIIVVLSGAPEFAARVEKAAELFKNGVGKIVVLTNDGTPGPWDFEANSNLSFQQMAFKELNHRGVPTFSIVTIPTAVHCTLQELVVIKEYAASLAVHRLILVTSPFHSRRTEWLAGHVFENSGTEFGITHFDASRQSSTRISAIRAVSLEYAKFILNGARLFFKPFRLDEARVCEL